MSLAFPNMFYKNSTQVLDGVEGTKNDLALILQCEKREQLGDPDFGVNLHKTKFSTNPSLAKELAVDGVIEAQNFVGNVLFSPDSVTISRTEVGKIDITIEAILSQAVNQRELLIIQGVNVE